MPENKFDADIIAAFDTRLIAADPDHPAPLLLWKGAGQQASVDMRAHWLVDNTMFPKELNDILKGVPPELCEAIFHGRNRMTILLNNNGGNLFAYHMLLAAAMNFYSRGGTVQTIVTNMAKSCAANITEFCNRRIALPHSAFMWHASRSDSQPNDPRAIAKDTARIRANFQLLPNPTHAAEATQRIDAAEADPENTYNDANFTGEELNKWGYVDQLPNSTEQAQDLFQTDIDQDINLHHWRSERIARFFLTSRMEEKILLDHDIHIEMFSTPTGGLTYGICDNGKSEEQIRAAETTLRTAMGEYL